MNEKVTSSIPSQGTGPRLWVCKRQLIDVSHQTLMFSFTFSLLSPLSKKSEY